MCCSMVAIGVLWWYAETEQSDGKNGRCNKEAGFNCLKEKSIAQILVESLHTRWSAHIHSAPTPAVQCVKVYDVSRTTTTCF